MRSATAGAALVMIYTVVIASADTITKFVAHGYAAPQLYCLSGLIVVGLCLIANRGRGFSTRCPRAMALRSAATVAAAVCFFYAFRLLPFAEVFLFIGLMPLLAGLMSGTILKEQIRPSAWAAMVAGFIGVLCLFPEGWGAIDVGHGFALAAAIFGTLSIVMARFIGRFETDALAQVFFPNLALFCTMAVALPFVWRPMTASDLFWVVAYAGLLFAARWVLVVALRLLAAYAVTPLMNLQFVWMVVLGYTVFGEVPGLAAVLGAAIVVVSGMFLVWDQATPKHLIGRSGKVKFGS